MKIKRAGARLKCHVSRAVIPQSDRIFLGGGGGRLRGPGGSETELHMLPRWRL